MPGEGRLQQPVRVTASISLPQAQLRSVLEANPDVATDAEVLEAIVAILASELEIPPVKALQLVSKRPALLQTRTQDVVVACDLLAAAMPLTLPGGRGGTQGSSREAMIQAVCRLPALLDFQPEELSAQAARAAAVMGVDKGEAGAMLCRAPDAGCLAAILAMPSNAMRQQLIDIQAVMDSR